MSNSVDDFKGRAVVYRAENCNDLPVLRCTDQDGNRVCVSAWQFTPEQLAQITANDGKVYLYIWGGGQPPVSLDHINPVSSMGSVERMKEELQTMIENIKQLAGQAKEAVRGNVTEARLNELNDAIEEQERWINLQRWMLNV